MKKKGYLAPVLVVVLLVLYYTGITAVFLTDPGIAGWFKALLCLVPLALSALAVAVLVQRIREIKSGEEDDLEQY